MSASYPNTVKTFTSRNVGDVIQPTHVNDLQDEVNAIEAGLLNGTAPLNSSRSTVASLNVTGNSTFAGNINIAGNSSCYGTAEFHGLLTQTNGTFIAQGGISLGTIVSPALPSTGNTNDLVVSSLASIIRLNVLGDSTLTGISGGQRSGQLFLIANVGSGSLKFAHTGASSAGNQFACPGSANLTLRTNGSVWTWYDLTSAFFRMVGI